MKWTGLLPWLCVVGLSVGVIAEYRANRVRDERLAVAREAAEQAQALRAEMGRCEAARAQRVRAQADELDCLRRGHEELIRLREEARQVSEDVRRLRDETARIEAILRPLQEARWKRYPTLRGVPLDQPIWQAPWYGGPPLGEPVRPNDEEVIAELLKREREAAIAPAVPPGSSRNR